MLCRKLLVCKENQCRCYLAQQSREKHASCYTTRMHKPPGAYIQSGDHVTPPSCLFSQPRPFDLVASSSPSQAQERLASCHRLLRRESWSTDLSTVTSSSSSTSTSTRPSGSSPKASDLLLLTASSVPEKPSHRPRTRVGRASPSQPLSECLPGADLRSFNRRQGCEPSRSGRAGRIES